MGQWFEGLRLLGAALKEGASGGVVFCSQASFRDYPPKPLLSAVCGNDCVAVMV
jgi:hypothetical protein